jgi:predicted ABC-type ATPase
VGSPTLYFLAGPNGAGKSTFYEAFLKDTGLVFVNADQITSALGISNTESSVAADHVRRHLIEERASFITETVFSDPVGAKLQFLRDAIAAGYDLTLIYIGIADAKLSEARVIQRVQAGGHDVPTERLERRFTQSLKNLVEAIAFVPTIQVFDNSDCVGHPFRLALTLRNGVIDFEADPLPTWLSNAMQEASSFRNALSLREPK